MMMSGDCNRGTVDPGFGVQSNADGVQRRMRAPGCPSEREPMRPTAPPADAGPPTGPSPPRAPARPLTAVAVMVGIALVSVAPVVVGARVTGGPDRSPPAVASVEEGVPAELAGGLEPGPVPDAVAAAFDEPVLGARVLDEHHESVEACSHMFDELDGEPELELAVITPEGARVSMLGVGRDGMVPADPQGDPAPPGAVRMRVTCNAEWDGQGWSGNGGSIGPLVHGPGEPDPGMGGGMTCCDARGLATAYGDVRVPGEATWAVQDRGDYWLALPTMGRPTVPVTWKFREGPFASSATHVMFVDDDGVLVDESHVRA